MLVIAFILGAISMFMLVCIGYAAKQEEPVNKVRFYVKTIEDEGSWLFIIADLLKRIINELKTKENTPKITDIGRIKYEEL